MCVRVCAQRFRFWKQKHGVPSDATFEAVQGQLTSRGLAFDPASQRGVVLMQVNPGQLFTFMAIEESPEALQLLLRDTRDALKRPAGTSYPVLTSLPGWCACWRRLWSARVWYHAGGAALLESRLRCVGNRARLGAVAG